MPAKSKAMQRFMGMVVSAKEGAKGMSGKVKEAAKGMSLKSARDFASTKLKGLPEKIGQVGKAVGKSAVMGAVVRRIKNKKVVK